MTSIQKFPISEFPTIYCSRLVVLPQTTSLKWDKSRTNRSIKILGDIDRVKRETIDDTTAGAIGNKGWIIGSDEISYYFMCFMTGKIYSGLVERDADLDNLKSPVYSRLFNVVEGDRVVFSLTTDSNLKIKHETGEGKLRSAILNVDLSSSSGKKLYYWVGTYPKTKLSLRVLEDSTFVTSVDSDGKVRMTASNSDIVDFSLGDIVENDPGSISNPVSGDVEMIKSSISIAEVKATVSGNIKHTGGISYDLKSISDSVTSYTLSLSEHILRITNANIIEVHLPSASSISGKEYKIIRDYPSQPSELWTNPVLSILPNLADTIDDLTNLKLPPKSNVVLVSDGIAKWNII